MKKRPVEINDLYRFKVIDNPQMSPDGKSVLSIVSIIDKEKNRYSSHIFITDLKTENTSQFTSGDVHDSSPRWSPDGSMIAFLRTRDKITQVYIINRDGGEALCITDLKEGFPGAPSWSRDGKRIALPFRPIPHDWTNGAKKDREKNHLSNPPRVITKINYRLEDLGFLDSDQHIWVLDIESKKIMQITDGNYDDSDPVWSFDSKTIAFTSNRCNDPEARPYEVEIWLVSAEGGKPRKLNAHRGLKTALSWSPDGKYIAYLGQEVKDDPWLPRQTRLFIAAINNKGAVCLTGSLDKTAELLTLTDIKEAFHGGSPPIWSKNSKNLYFLISSIGSCHLYCADLNGNSAKQLTNGEMEISAFSGNGDDNRFIILKGNSTNLPELYLYTGKAESKKITGLNDGWHEGIFINKPEMVYFKSFDGTKIQGWILKPAKLQKNKKYPMILYVHGGPHAQYGNAFFHEFQCLSSMGYVIFYTNPRGSFGYSERFGNCIKGNWGDVDFKDIMSAVTYAKGLSYVDSERMAICGGSYGGYMANWAVGNTDEFRCAVSERSVVNLHSMFGTSDYPEIQNGYWGGDSWGHPENLWKQSPLRFAAKVKTPLLLIHSEGDLRCAIEQAEQFFVALRRLKRDVVFLRYPAETNHGLSRTGPPDLRIDRLNRIIEWLDQHLK